MGYEGYMCYDKNGAQYQEEGHRGALSPVGHIQQRLVMIFC